jgi:hypothetical protein
MGSVMAHRLQSELGEALRGAPEALRGPLREVIARPDLVVGPLHAAGPPEVLAHMRVAMAHAVGAVFVVGLVICLVALASAFLVPAGQARDDPACGRRAGGAAVSMPGDVPLLERLASLPPVPVSDLLALLERLPGDARDPVLAGLVGVSEEEAVAHRSWRR